MINEKQGNLDLKLMAILACADADGFSVSVCY
jgi:hypothetical protein